MLRPRRVPWLLGARRRAGASVAVTAITGASLVLGRRSLPPRTWPNLCVRLCPRPRPLPERHPSARVALTTRGLFSCAGTYSTNGTRTCEAFGDDKCLCVYNGGSVFEELCKCEGTQPCSGFPGCSV